ncbi:sugar MFS transporter [Saliphagus sp. LR7]|uniref:MFS transporter n=1 Tax=Saliphagus sp. LR7 TaxID=2282654 RepID=UPI000DF85B49|nr:MFS transporter [Saliphagus sp. LR7]
MAWAVGATLGPLLATAALVVWGWRLAFLVLACAFVPVVVAFGRLEAPGFEAEEALAPRELASLLRRPTVGTMALLLVLLSLVEGGIFTWLPYYVGESLPRSVANLSLSLYLAAYVPGRYAFSRATERVDELALVFASAALATAALVGFLSTSGYAMLGAVAVVGFLVAGMFPTLLAWATDHVPEYSGPVNAVAFVASGAGFAIFPAAMGGVAGRYTIGAAMALLAAAMAVFALVAAAVVLRDR